MLHHLFNQFDTLADTHGVFKVETIGDAWMGVTNCVCEQSEDHVKHIAQYSLDAVQAASETLIDLEDPDRGYVQIRVGFHSGPVLSNVIGTHNPHYSLFGDAVNTASRMESHSKPGQIHCSERSALLLQEQAPDIPTSCRGDVPITGKGKMVTYWVPVPEKLAKSDDEGSQAERDDSEK
jgi:class 3 adenylate cyclase